MPELAAHLERVAKELVELTYVLSLQMPRGPDDEPLAEMSVAYAQGALVPLLTPQQVNAIMPIVAAALAACAREEALEWDKTAQLHITRWTELEWRNKRLRALERAVGEKGAAK